MSQPAPSAGESIGPFTIGSSPDALIDQATKAALGLRVVERDQQKSEYDKSRCEALEQSAREFFFNYDDSSSLIFQKTRETHLIPEFIEFIYCWFACDRLAGLVLSGVTSDAGTHDQIDEQERTFRAHAEEVAEALGRKYPELTGPFVNHFHFSEYHHPPAIPGFDHASLLVGYDRLLEIVEDDVTLTNIAAGYCGPSIIIPPRNLAEEINAGGSHSSRHVRKIGANAGFLVVYDNKYERYVRTFESIHMFDTIAYISRTLMDDLGRSLNALRCERVQEEARSRIATWRDSQSQVEEARRQKIARLAEIL